MVRKKAPSQYRNIQNCLKESLDTFEQNFNKHDLDYIQQGMSGFYNPGLIFTASHSVEVSNFEENAVYVTESVVQPSVDASDMYHLEQGLVYTLRWRPCVDEKHEQVKYIQDQLERLLYYPNKYVFDIFCFIKQKHVDGKLSQDQYQMDRDHLYVTAESDIQSRLKLLQDNISFDFLSIQVQLM